MDPWIWWSTSRLHQLKFGGVQKKITHHRYWLHKNNDSFFLFRFFHARTMSVVTVFTYTTVGEHRPNRSPTPPTLANEPPLVTVASPLAMAGRAPRSLTRPHPPVCPSHASHGRSQELPRRPRVSLHVLHCLLQTKDDEELTCGPRCQRDRGEQTQS